MDRHVKWLRRHIITSIATQTAATFAVVAIVLFVILRLATSFGLFGAIFASVVVAQFAALARAALSMRSNPLNYSFMKKSVEKPFTHQVSRFQGVESAHVVASNLPGFAPVATIRDADGSSGPVFDVYHDPSRLVAASVSRSGALSLMSSLAGGRLLTTSANAVPPHERRVMNVATEDSVDAIIASHRVALSKHGNITPLETSAHQVVLDSLALEYESYAQLGPVLSSFLDLDNMGRSWRVTTQVGPDELAELPKRLGFSGGSGPAVSTPVDELELDEIAEVTRITYAATQPAVPETSLVIAPDTGETIVIPEVVAPKVDASGVVAAEAEPAETAAAPSAAAPLVVAPTVGDLAAGAEPVGNPAASNPETRAHSITEIVRGDAVDATVASEVASSSSIGEVLGDVVAPVAAAAPRDPLTAAEVVDADKVAGIAEAQAGADKVTGIAEAQAGADKVTGIAEAQAGADKVAGIVEAEAGAVSTPVVGPTPFVTVEPDTIADLDSSEPITAEVPAVVFTESPVPADASKTDAAAAAAATEAAPPPAAEDELADDGANAGDANKVPFFPASLGGSVDTATFTARQAPVNSPQLVNRVLSSLRSLGSKTDMDDEQDSEDRAATLAEAMPSAPDTAAELTADTAPVSTASAVSIAAAQAPAPAASVVAAQAPVSAVSVAAAQAPVSTASVAAAQAPVSTASSSQASFSQAASAPAPTSQTPAVAGSVPTTEALAAAASAAAETSQYSLADISVPAPTGTQTTVTSTGGTQTTVTSTAGTVLEVPTSSEESADIPVAYHGVPELLAPSASRPKLSDRLKASQPEAPAVTSASSKRTRRKKR